MKFNKKNYLKNKGGVCPYCGSRNIEGLAGYKTEDSAITTQVECHNCKQTWTDIYTLTDVEKN